MSEIRTGWERENRTHFDDIAENYDKIRWDYPSEIFHDIVSYCKINITKAVEIGAGTGKATAPFLDAGYMVTAVEMGQNMVNFLKYKFRDYDNFDVITSTFEDVQLEQNSYEVVYAASAFHWVDAAVGCPKVVKLLKDGGVFAIFRNNAVPKRDALFFDVHKIYDTFFYSYYTTDNRTKSIYEMKEADFWKQEEIYRGFRLSSLEEYGFRNVKMKLYDETLIYTAKEYISLLETYSDHRALPADNKAALYSGIEQVIAAHGGYQTLQCIFQLYMGTK